MRDESKKRLELFVERATYIENLSYLEDAENLVGFEVNTSGEKWQVDFYQPDDEERDALLFNLRLFVQDKDDISIRRMTELYSDHGISIAWKHEHRTIREELNAKLDVIAAEGLKGTITHRDIFYMFLYGKLGHLDEDDSTYKLYQEWVTNDTAYAYMHNTFHSTIIWILVAVINISRACRDELLRQSSED
jgi:hypothetical protein